MKCDTEDLRLNELTADEIFVKRQEFEDAYEDYIDRELKSQKSFDNEIYKLNEEIKSLSNTRSKLKGKAANVLRRRKELTDKIEQKDNKIASLSKEKVMWPKKSKALQCPASPVISSHVIL